MVEVERKNERIDVSNVLTALLSEFSAITDYRTLQDSLPRRLALLLKCRYVLCYQRIGETLQFVAGSSDDRPGWSSSLLSVARINPVDLNSDVPEACAWRERHAILRPAFHPTLLAVPLIYRQRGIGVLVALRLREEENPQEPSCWSEDEVPAMEAIAGVVALLLENTRLLERDRERIHELSLLNSISSQMNCSLYNPERLRNIVIQRVREIAVADWCEIIEAGGAAESVSWVPLALREKLFKHFHGQYTPTLLIIERPGKHDSAHGSDYYELLEERIKTFFAFPLLSGHITGRRGGSLLRGSLGSAQELIHEPKVLGIVVGAYTRPWKLRRAEIVLLQVLASQASAVLENMHLMAEVVEARNEARKLLRQVLDDQRIKELILESIPSGLITTDRKGCITTFNRAAEAILGYHPYEVLGQPLYKYIDLRSSGMGRGASSPVESPEAEGEPGDLFDNVFHLGDVQSETIVTEDRHGREIVLDVDTLPLCGDFGERIGTLATFTDVTSVHRLEEEKRRLDRLATLGEMAANVAHEVRNPLASIKTSMQMLMDDLQGNELSSLATSALQDEKQINWAQEAIKVVLKEVERLDTIVRELLLFAKPRQLHRVRCNLEELCDRVLQLIQPQCAEANVVVHRLYDEVPPICVDIAQMEQVLLNLYMNAIQAMPDGGVVTIACRVVCAERESSDQDEYVRDARKAPGDVAYSCLYELANKNSSQVRQWIELSVSDTGVGIAPEQQERIFQPFFTTKAHGIGLGLAITRRLVEDHGGTIRVEGMYGYGATITIQLPLEAEETSCEHDESNNVEIESEGLEEV